MPLGQPGVPAVVLGAPCPLPFSTAPAGVLDPLGKTPLDGLAQVLFRLL
ncbi:hypothetical protein [Actinomadura nitritigenes]|uniref:Uncharacterized protein n=1 Tax=Actinomadura nitritigenes TaxID=134602 RepID=A0ABS3R2J1_9ACTN|nr:hypothetical protein [Actinomadura nitritigenes]MBO2439809.1 hypothetical protein [Actinomadura nitritigenes]